MLPRKTGYLATLLCATSLFALMSGCGSGSSSLTGGTGNTDCSQPSAQDSQTCLYVSLTDATGPFDAYIVTVDSLSLTRNDGTVVNLLPNQATVDLAQYDTLAEFLTLQSVPPGIYTKGSMVLDYSNADIEVDVNGVATKATPLDASGQALTKLTVTIAMPSDGPLTLVPGVPQVFGLDFDLSASNLVDTTVTPATVTVSPVLYAEANPDWGKTLQLRGPLASVDTANNRFTLALRPFLSLSGSFGSPTVSVTDTTAYLINTQTYTGATGLAALQAAGVTTAVRVRGSYNFSSHQFVATEVDAGSSVPGGTLDAVRGVVTAVNGSTVTIRGATLIRAQQSAVFADNVTVTDGSATIVRKQGNASTSLTPLAISVGQHILCMGTLTNTTPGALALNVTQGFVLLKPTHVGASVVAVNSGSLTLNVQSFEGRPVAAFSFTGTNSDPTHYVTDTGALPLGNVAAGDPVRVTGFVTSFGSAPPDFDAVSVADFQSADAQLAVGYIEHAGTTAPFATLDATTGIVIDMANPAVGFVHTVRKGPVAYNLTATLNPTLKPSGTLGIGLYAIKHVSGELQLFATFKDFVTALQGTLNGTTRVYGVFASGAYDQTTGIMSANRMAVLVK